MTNNGGLAFCVGDTSPRFTISVEQDNQIGETKYHIHCSDKGPQLECCNFNCRLAQNVLGGTQH
jgi:hypothetical protein